MLPMREIIRNKLNLLREELASYTKKERAFIFFAMLCGFFVCCEYSIIRPVSNSLFIHAFSVNFLPYAWLAIVPLNFLIVSLYNRLIPKWGSQKLFVCLLSLVIGTNVLFALFAKTTPILTFLFYMWKEVYVLMMFQLVWSVINANVKLGKAKYLYGFFFGIGGLGSMLGSSFPSFFAVTYGSETLIFLTLPVYLLLLFVYWRMSHYCSGEVLKEDREQQGGVLHGMRLIGKSRFLLFALFIVVFMQMISAIVDFQFNHFLQDAFPEKDVRTEYSARILGIVHTMTVIFQFIGTYVLIKWMGYRRSHYALPSILATSTSLLALFPVFPIASLVFITCKSLDFSVFGIIKEMLYIPLKPDEKFRAKAVIDVLAYRTSKAFASLLIILVTAFFPFHMLTWVNFIIAILWIFSISFGLRGYEKIPEAS